MGTQDDDLQPSIEEMLDPDEPEAVYLPLPGDTENRAVILTDEQRREILGRLAEFEFMLAELNTRQQSFVISFLRDPTNAAQAARNAGYSEGSAKVAASHLMNNKKILSCIASGQLLREDRTMITSDRTLNELAVLAFSDIRDFEVEPGTNNIRTREGVPEYAGRAVSQAEFVTTARENKDGSVETTYKVKIKLWSKPDALRLLMQYQKMLNPAANNTIIDKSVHNTWQIGDRQVNF